MRARTDDGDAPETHRERNGTERATCSILTLRIDRVGDAGRCSEYRRRHRVVNNKDKDKDKDDRVLGRRPG